MAEYDAGFSQRERNPYYWGGEPWGGGSPPWNDMSPWGGSPPWYTPPWGSHMDPNYLRYIQLEQYYLIREMYGMMRRMQEMMEEWHRD